MDVLPPIFVALPSASISTRRSRRRRLLGRLTNSAATNQGQRQNQDCAAAVERPVSDNRPAASERRESGPQDKNGAQTLDVAMEAVAGSVTDAPEPNFVEAPLIRA